MNLLARIKAAFSSDKFIQSSMHIMHGGSGEGGKRQAFSPTVAVNAYRSWIYAAANLNAVAVASSPLRLYVKRRNGTKLWQTRRTDRRTKAYLAGDAAQRPSVYAMRKAAEYGDDYEVVTDSHPVLELLSKVNPYQNGFDLAVLRVLYGELTGNAYLHPVIDQRLGIPTELWVMPSQYTEIVPGKEKFIDGYLYGASREQRRFFAEDEVIHFKRPNPADLYYGIGKLEAAWGVAMMNMAAHEMDLGFFENKARPDYLLTIKTAAHPDEIERLEAQIDEKLRGARRTGRFLTATADIDVKPLSFAPKDLAGRDEVVEEIAAIFGVPVSMLKANDPNLASANAGYAMWRETTILPLLRMDEEVMNQKLLPLFGIEEDAFLAYDNPVPSDRVYELQARQAGVAGGWRTANEARAEEGQEPVDDPMADRLLVGGAPLGGPPAPPAPQGVPFGAASVEAVEAPSVEMPQPETKDALSDCVSEKIPTLIEEGYDRDQAVAIAYSMCSEGKSLEAVLSERAPSAETKAISDIDTKPPKGVADNARRALEVRATKPESERGMTAVGIARARDLANRKPLSEDTIRRMLAYFERHEVDKQGSTWDEQGKGWQAWNGWGGDDGWSWARRKVDEFDRERERKSKSCGFRCRKDSTIAAQVESKDCGTGSGGFKPGNTCGDEEGSGGDDASSSRSKPSRVLETEAGHEVQEFDTEADIPTEALDDDVDVENGVAIDFDQAIEMQAIDEISGSGAPKSAMEAYTGDAYPYFTGQEDFPREDSIKAHGLEYGVIDDESRDEILESEYERKVAEIEQQIEDDPDYFPPDYTEEEKQEAIDEAFAEARQMAESYAQQAQDESIIDAAKAMRADLESATAKSRLKCCIRLMRGLSIDETTLDEIIKSGYMTHDGVNSWTTDKRVAESFGGKGTLIVLKNPRVGWVNSSDSRSEKEVVRPPSSLKIVKVTRTKTGTVVEVEEDEDY